MEFKLGSANIYELGQLISEKLGELGVSEKSELTVYVGKEQFMKVDEDLYYRNKEEDSEKFVPSDDEILVNFDKVLIKIMKAQ